MPGFLFHLIEGQMIIDKLNIDKTLSTDFIEGFMFGCIVPDATSNKELTHFRPLWQKELITKYPDMNYILKKYMNTKLSPCDLGILAHLQLDSLYVKEYWDKHFVFEAKDNSRTNVHKCIDHVRLLDRGTCIPYSEFFTDKYFYGDYDILNPLIYTKHKPYIPKEAEYPSDKISIIECRDYDKAIISNYIYGFEIADAIYDDSEIPETKVLNYKSLIDFLDNTAAKYINQIYCRYE